MPTIEKSVLIRARVGQVWDVLTTPRLIGEWADTFQPGMYAESAWLKGCEVHWKSASGEVLLKGLVADAKRGAYLEVVFGHDLNPAIPKNAQAFSETYALMKEGDAVRLTVVCGPMPDREYSILNGRWTKAVETIRDLAEAGGAARIGASAAEPPRPAHG